MDTPNNHGTRTSNTQLLTEVQFDQQERITVAEPFTFIQCKLLLSKSGREGSPKQENYLHETLHVGKFSVILMGILLGHH
jgi:hypothetical protein